MRVLFITGEFPPLQGGVGDCTNEIAQALAMRGVEVSVLATDPSLTPRTGTRRTTKNVPTSLHVHRTIKAWNWSALSHIRRVISETRADIAHIQYQTGAFGQHPMINFAPRWFPAPAKRVVTFHDLLPAYLFPKAGRVRDWVTFQLARSCDAVIATNEEDFARLFALNLKLLNCIRIGSNIDPTPPPNFERNKLRTQLGVAPDEILLCYFGFLNESKGAETLIRALAELSDAKLVFLGGQTGASDPTNIAYLERVKRLIAELGLTSRVIWTDFLPQPQVSAHFLASDVCVLPYRDGVSFRRGTFMAALAHGMAIVTTHSVVATSPPSLPFLEAVGAGGRGLPALRDSENLLLVPPEHPHAIANAVKRIAASPALRAKLQQGARQTAAFFTWDKIADGHLELYEKLLGA